MAIVTGSVRNIGSATAIELARARASGIVNYRSPEILCHQVKTDIEANGGSAANANHINGDFTKTFTGASNTIRINSFADNSCFLTAASNDIDFSEAFSILIPGRINKNDLVIFLSGSGNSVNLVKCARKAKEHNINTFCITGYQGGELNKICKNRIHIPVKDMEIIEDLQLIIFHCIKQNLYKKLKNKFEINQISSKYV